MTGKLGVATLLACVASSVLAYPFNLAHFHQFEKLAKLNAASPYAIGQQPFANNQFKPVFNPQLEPQQYNPQQYNNQQYNPQGYLADPLGSFPVKSPFGASYDQVDYTKMAGESFFKRPGQNQEEEETAEEVPYSVIKDFGTYEERFYPAAKFACVKSEVDTSKDPMAGLEKENPFVIMTSKRWKKSPASIMFMELFKYIAGVNQDGQEVEMTRPVSTLHKVEQKQAGGDIEVQEMCFYLPQKFQSSPPQPLEKSPVYILERPEMAVFALRFGGFALSADSWLAQKSLLESYIVGNPHNENEYFTNGYNSPFALTNRRNEIWIQCQAHLTKPAEAAEASPLPEQVADASPLPGKIVEAAPLPGDIAEDAPLPGVPVEAMPLPGEVAEDNKVKASTYSLESKEEDHPEVSVKPADGVHPAPLPADVEKPAPVPADVAEPVPLPADATQPAPLPVDAAQPVPLPEDAPQPAPLPAEVADPAPLPAEVADPAPLPADVADPAPLPADVAQPAPLPADVAQPAPLPADVAQPAPLPSDVAQPAPLPADVAEPAPLPADVAGPAVLAADVVEPSEAIGA